MFIPAGLFFFVFAVYLRTHCATFNINDSGETIMVCDLLTISHSPGYPLHTLWGRVNCLLPLGKPMFRVTFASLLAASFSVVVLYWTLRMMLKSLFSAPDPSSAAASSPAQGSRESSLTGMENPGTLGSWAWEIPALFGSLLFAFSYQHWFQACGAKGGIYTLNTLLSVCMLFLFFKMRESGWFTKAFLLMGFVYGLSLAHHWPNQIVMAPAYFWFLIANQKKIPFRDFFGWAANPMLVGGLALTLGFFWMVITVAFSKAALPAFLLAAAVTFCIVAAVVVVRVLGWLYLFITVLIFGISLILSILLYSPIPSFPGSPPPSLSPVPAIVLSFLFAISAILARIFGLANFMKSFGFGLLSLSVYLYLPIRCVQNPIVNWWNPKTLTRLIGTVLREGYKGIGDNNRGWQTISRNLDRFWFHAQHQFGDVFTVLVFALAVFGVLWMWRNRGWMTAIGVGFFGFGVFVGVIGFNNPLEGYQWTLDNFFSPIFMMVSIFAAAGVAGLNQWTLGLLKDKIQPEADRLSESLQWKQMVWLVLALLPLLLNWKGKDSMFRSGNDQSRYVSSYDEGMNMFKSVNDDAVILCNGDIDILPLWYLQFVEGKRPKVITFTMQLIPYDWYRDPLFKRWPMLEVPVNPTDPRPEIVVQEMIDRHKDERSFYFTNIFTAPWLRDKDPAMPEGFLWRVIASKGMNYPLTSARLDKLWSTYRLRYMDPPLRGYWDEYTDVMKDSYGIGYDFTGLFTYMNSVPDLYTRDRAGKPLGKRAPVQKDFDYTNSMLKLGLWSYNNALKYRQGQTLPRIFLMIGETYLGLGNPMAAVPSYQENLKMERNPYACFRMGDAFFMMKDMVNAEAAYRAALSINPQQVEASNGLLVLTKPSEAVKQFEQVIQKAQREKMKPGETNIQLAYYYAKLGDAHLMLNDREGARKAYRQSLAVNLGQMEARNGLRQLGEKNI